MNGINDARAHTIVIKSSAQVGKTEIINNIVGYFIDHEPSPILVMQPTEKMAETWSRDRLAPMLRDTPVLRDRMKVKATRNTGDTLLYKQFTGGYIAMVGANAPSGLASRPVRVVLADEVDRYPASAGKEGDPVSLARKRTTTFWNRKIILTSTPTDANSRIEQEYLLSDQREYYCPCPHCGFMQTIKWTNIIIPKDDDGNWLTHETFLACEQGCIIHEDKKIWMVKHGEWRATKPFNGTAGFYINELYSPWVKWSETAADFKVKKGDPETLKTWTNTAMGEVWYDRGEAADLSIEELLSRRENYDADSIPEGVLFLTAAADTQDDRLEVLVQGWGEDKERWNIEHTILWGDTSQQQVWDDLDDYFNESFGGMKIACKVVDSGGSKGRTDMVYDFCKPRQKQKVFAIKGSSQYFAPIASKPSQVGRQRVQLYSIGTDTAKQLILFNYLHIKSKIHFPQTVDEEFFLQLLGEERQTKRVMGQERYEFRKVRDRQEILDLHVYNEAAYAILNPNIEKIKARKAQEPKQQEPEKEEDLRRTTQRPMRKLKRRKNWVTNF